MKINYEVQVKFDPTSVTPNPEWSFDTRCYTLEEALAIKEIREGWGIDTAKFRVVKCTREPLA